MNSDAPAGLFVTWTVYGTFLPGDQRGWRHRRKGEMQPQPNLARWSQGRLKFPIKLLNAEERSIVEHAVLKRCRRRTWKCWCVTARSNHVHVVVTAASYHHEEVRDQLKATATQRLREAYPQRVDRSVWSTKGDIEFLEDESEIAEALLYCTEAQDRKSRDM